MMDKLVSTVEKNIIKYNNLGAERINGLIYFRYGGLEKPGQVT